PGHPPATGRRPVAAPTVSCAPRQVCWLLLRPLEQLSGDEQAYLTRLYHARSPPGVDSAVRMTRFPH
ncbi:MAG TPA: hypothetical protein VKV02_08995, partial [Acidobacteriaceae bacterium]|nr:hypothetical protein [Acidobacteriaceae bacterium]